ncbi:hypothetical protein HALA3H3_160010 [Halomonas sp. A3H3]|nr:hypothetical protein HALA3H3_160010 [Halomonas sp. A3H3]
MREQRLLLKETVLGVLEDNSSNG